MNEPFRVDPYGESKAKIPPDVLRETPIEDKRGFWTRLRASLRVKVTTKKGKADSVNITGGTSF